MSVKLIWITPEAEKQILYMARVSSDNQDSSDTRLLKYLINHKHWSPFEMVNACFEIETSRAISAQILRHRSFSFQEFSQRYAETVDIIEYPARRQDINNRQNSIDDLDIGVKMWWETMQENLIHHSKGLYKEALKLGVAKECARMLLPMSSKTKLYMNGSLRSWIHYLELRTHESTQLEHRVIANQIKDVLYSELPIIGKVLEELND